MGGWWGIKSWTFYGFLAIISVVDRYFYTAGLTVRDSLLRPLVTKLKPWVSMATPVRWICSSTYLPDDEKEYTDTVIQCCSIGGELFKGVKHLSNFNLLKLYCIRYLTEYTVSRLRLYRFNALDYLLKPCQPQIDRMLMRLCQAYARKSFSVACDTFPI